MTKYKGKKVQILTRWHKYKPLARLAYRLQYEKRSNNTIRGCKNKIDNNKK